MPTFDVVNQVDLQELDNAINNVKKEIMTRFDFRGIETLLEFDKKDKNLSLTTGDEMKLKAVKEMLVGHAMRRGVDHRCMDFGKIEPTSKGAVKMTIKIKEGIEIETEKKIVKMIKDKKMKVQAAIQNEQVRVTSKKIDDLQEVIAMLKGSDIQTPLQFVNMKK